MYRVLAVQAGVLSEAAAIRQSLTADQELSCCFVSWPDQAAVHVNPSNIELIIVAADTLETQGKILEWLASQKVDVPIVAALPSDQC